MNVVVSDHIYCISAFLNQHKMSFHKNELLSEGASSSNGTTVVGLSMAQQLASERSFGASHVGGASFMKSYDCRFCGKQFSKMSKLTQHMKIHSNPEDHYKYPCDICGKKVKNIHFYPFLFNLAPRGSNDTNFIRFFILVYSSSTRQSTQAATYRRTTVQMQ